MNDLQPVTDRARISDISGEVFGKLTVIEPAGIKRYRNGMAVYFRCRCECGGEVVAQKANLRSGSVVSCGCHRAREETAPAGASGHPLFKTWRHMLDRCGNANNRSFVDYGARGIGVCDRWRGGDGDQTGFELFCADMGPRPSPEHMLERTDNERGYEPGNCTWATRAVQNSNKRSNCLIEIDGETCTVAEWSRRYGRSEFLIYRRLDRGWQPKAAVLTPPLKHWRRTAS